MMKNPLEKYRYKFEKDSWKPASIEEIELFESEHSLILPPELKLYYQLYNGAFLRHCYYPNIILRSAIDPEGLDKGGGITIDKFFKINASYFPEVYPGFYPGSPSEIDYDSFRPFDDIPFEKWEEEFQKDNPWFEGWYPEKKSEYLAIGRSQGTGFLLIGMTAKNFGQLFHWDPDIQEKYNPNYIATSVSEMLERLIER